MLLMLQGPTVNSQRPRGGSSVCGPQSTCKGTDGVQHAARRGRGDRATPRGQWADDGRAVCRVGLVYALLGLFVAVSSGPWRQARGEVVGGPEPISETETGNTRETWRADRPPFLDCWTLTVHWTIRVAQTAVELPLGLLYLPVGQVDTGYARDRSGRRRAGEDRLWARVDRRVGRVHVGDAAAVESHSTGARGSCCLCLGVVR